ncbi:HNH endonuclease [Amycolatopsis sp.]|uniref:HNH endonuclease n=1 Tax=Amycolatopsis sp. TaxID=37632 RepID=UPI0039C85F7E
MVRRAGRRARGPVPARGSVTAKRGTSNRNARGSSTDRRRRRAWLLVRFGDGRKAPCYRCGRLLTERTITVDRVTPGAEGGTYRRDNIRPACGRCNSETGGQLGAARRTLALTC